MFTPLRGNRSAQPGVNTVKNRSNLTDILKVLLLCSCFIIIIVYVSITGISSLNTVNTSFNSFYQKQFIPVVKINSVIRCILQIRVNMIEGQNAALHGDIRELRKRMSDSQDLARQYNSAMRGMREQVNDPASVQFMEQWDKEATHLAGVRENFFISLEQGNPAKGRTLYGQWLTGYRELRDDTFGFISRQEKIGSSTLGIIESNTQSIIKKSFFILGISIVLGFVTTWVLARLFLKGAKKDFGPLA